MLRINLTRGLVHSEILQEITFVRCNLIIVASFKNKYTFLMPAGKSKGKNHDLSPIFMSHGGRVCTTSRKLGKKPFFSYTYKTEFFHLPQTFFQTLICLSIRAIMSLLETEFVVFDFTSGSFSVSNISLERKSFNWSRVLGLPFRGKLVTNSLHSRCVECCVLFAHQARAGEFR